MIRRNVPLGLLVCGLLIAPHPCLAQDRWWMDEPVRLVQTNLRETDSGLDPVRLVGQVADFPANTLLFGCGGIVAHYPTEVEFHYRSPHLPPGRDPFGETLREAHRRGIRVIGRFDFSRAPKPVFEAHPEWFFRSAEGRPVVDENGLHSSCINGGYYWEHAARVLDEALSRYDMDGLFFNMFGNPSTDYHRRPIGLCHCGNCRARFQARYGRPLPDHPDEDYRRFLFDCSNEVAARFAELIHGKRRKAALLTYLQDHVDGIMSESNTAVPPRLPLWPYSASENVNRARNSRPGKMAFNLCMAFVDFRYRAAAVPRAEVRLRLYQNMAQGAGPSFAVLGTLDQEDRTSLAAARPVFRWHAEHEDLYVGQRSAARVLLLAEPSPGSNHDSDGYKGFYRLLSELHIPFAASDDLGVPEREPDRFDLIIVPGKSSVALDGYLGRGGRLLIAGAEPPALELPKTVRTWAETRGSYFRIHDHALFPSLKDTDLLFLDGAYRELVPSARPLLTLIPPSRFGPPEKVFTDKVETDKPGLLLADYGKGRLAYVPWDVGALYHRLGSDSHRGFVADLIDRLLPVGRQLRTDAHPLVEVTIMEQPARGRTLVHLVNLSGHSDTAYHPPVPMRDIALELVGRWTIARAIGLGKDLPVTRAGRSTRFVVQELGEYEVVILE
jgi:hypothetical protein